MGARLLEGTPMVVALGGPSMAGGGAFRALAATGVHRGVATRHRTARTSTPRQQPPRPPWPPQEPEAPGLRRGAGQAICLCRSRYALPHLSTIPVCGPPLASGECKLQLRTPAFRTPQLHAARHLLLCAR